MQLNTFLAVIYIMLVLDDHSLSRPILKLQGQKLCNVKDSNSQHEIFVPFEGTYHAAVPLSSS